VKAWSVCNGQKTFAGETVFVCDVCGRRVAKQGRHPRCVQRLANAASIIKSWSMRAMQKEVATKKRQNPPKSLLVLSRIAGVPIEG